MIRDYGYSMDELTSMTIGEIRPSEDVARVMENVRDLRSKQVYLGQWRHTKKDGTIIEVEVTSEEEALDALKTGADIIMLDNMSPDEIRRIVDTVGGQVKLEASGNITLKNVHQVAMTGVDMISIGALTHSYKSLDISLEIEPQTLKLI